jgi:conjugative transfer signal peptidase TraF
MRFIPIGVLAFAVGLPAGIQRSGLLMNYSDSVPLGIYRRVPAKSANRATSYAGFCLPRATANAAIQAGLDVEPGACPGGLAPVLKPVICPSPGHPLIYDAQGFSFDGKMLPNTVPKSQSRTGVPLEHYAFGVYTSGIWALSDFNPNSYDSRYFGPVAPDAIRFYAKPVWTW